MASRSMVASHVLLMISLLSGTPSFAQKPEPAAHDVRAWYRHPQGIYRVPLSDGWEVVYGVRGTVKDEQFDTLFDPTRQYSILCWRSSEKVSDDLAALEKYRDEKLKELASYADVHSTGISYNGVPMMRVAYQTSEDRMVSRISAVKNGRRVVINTVSPLGPTSGQLPRLVDDLIAAIEFPDRGVPVAPPVTTPRQPPVQDASIRRPTVFPPDSVLETQKASIGPAGGHVTLPSGLRLEFPQDAVARETDVLFERLRSEVFSSNDPSKYVVLNCLASVPQFEKPVEIRMPLSSRIPEDSPPPLAGTLDEETGLLELCPTRFETTRAGMELVLTTNHFCHIVLPSEKDLQDWLEPPPASAGPIETGIYKQGDTKFCWAMTMQTQARAYKAGTNSAYNILGDVGMSFVDPVDIRWRPNINNWFQNRAGQQPERLFWGTSILSGSDVFLDKLKRYIRREVGRNGRPVLLGRKTWSKGHSWLIVGYDDQENFIVHDSQNPPDILPTSKDMGYFKVSSGTLGLDWGIPIRNSYVTVAIPLPLNPQRSLATLNIPHRAIWFNNPSVPNCFVFGWTHATPEGYEWLQAKFFDKSGEVFDAPLPPTVEELQLGNPQFTSTGLEVINGSLSEIKTMTVEIEVGKDGEEPRFKKPYDVIVGPNSREPVSKTIPVEKFRLPEDVGLVKYRFQATLRENNVTVDQAAFTFEIGPGKWFEMEVTREMKKQGPGFAVAMIPKRIFWCEPVNPNATETQVTLHYALGAEGRPPLSAGNRSGILPRITLRAMREGDDYVIRGPVLDDIANQAEFSWRHMIMMLITGIEEAANIDPGESGRQKDAEIKARRQATELMQVGVENIEFRLRPDGDTLRLTVKGKATSTIPNEEPQASEADVEVVGQAEKK